MQGAQPFRIQPCPLKLQLGFQLGLQLGFRRLTAGSILTLAAIVTSAASNCVAESLTQSPLTSAVHLSVRTAWGLERFLFDRTGIESPTLTERHLQGRSLTTSNSRGASLSFVGGSANLYFLSKRSHHPTVAHIRITPRGLMVVGRLQRSRGLPGSACATEAGSTSTTARRGQTTSPLAITNLGSQNLPTKLVPPRLVKVGTFADAEWLAAFGSGAEGRMREVINAADAIFATDIGIRLTIAGQKTFSPAEPPISGVTAGSVLESFRTRVLSDTFLPRGDVQHLFTGRKLSGMTIGLAYVATACTSNGEYSFAVSQRVNDVLQPLLAAHEIAHNLSATHELVAGSIMNPSLTSTDSRFSANTLGEVSSFVNSAGACLATGPLHTISVRAGFASARTTFRAVAKVTSELEGACTVRLVSATSSQALVKPTGSGILTLSRTDIVSPGDSALREVVFEATSPPLPARAQSVFIQARLECVDGVVFSKIRELRLRGAPEGPKATVLDPGRWIRGLKARFAGR